MRASAGPNKNSRKSTLHINTPPYANAMQFDVASEYNNLENLNIFWVWGLLFSFSRRFLRLHLQHLCFSAIQLRNPSSMPFKPFGVNEPVKCELEISRQPDKVTDAQPMKKFLLLITSVQRFCIFISSCGGFLRTRDANFASIASIRFVRFALDYLAIKKEIESFVLHSVVVRHGSEHHKLYVCVLGFVLGNGIRWCEHIYLYLDILLGLFCLYGSHLCECRRLSWCFVATSIYAIDS